MKTQEEKTKYHKQYHKVWYKENKEKRKLQLKAYAQKHKADAVKRTLKYVSKNKDKVALYNKEFSQTSEGRYRFYKYSAKARHHEFSITLESFAAKLERPCEYCGDSEKIGIDRIDNGIGYTEGNTAPCCTICNFMKKTHSVEYFLSHIKKIYVQNYEN